MKSTYPNILFALSLLILFSCANDDDVTYVPINITAQPDQGSLFQNETITVDVLSNDSNLPEDGTLTVETPSSGTVTVEDPNNTPNNILDDVVTYTPASNYVASQILSYTICDAEGLSCATSEITLKIYQPINIDVDALPYPNLSDYNFFYDNMANQEPVPGVLPYKPISTLFTDYALKKRFVWMPNNTSASYAGDANSLDFPTGAILVKNFYYENVQPNNTTQIIETRLLIKKSDGWITADYIWNESQDEGLLDTTGNGGFVDIEWVNEEGESQSTNYRIPANSQCFTCHKANFENSPIGMKPQSLNAAYSYTDGSSNQLQKWIDMGYLENNLPSNIVTVVDYNDTSQPLNTRVRSYFDINCASCHSDDGHCNYRAIRFAFNESSEPESLGVCVTPDTPITGYENAKIVDPGNPENSVLFFRLSTNEEQYRMPLLGRTIQHQEGVALVEEWINSLNQNCN
ncbi:MAG: hypothetical protein K0U54_02975 [Bacteroidetes bacterium]|nr:hypothetical protein [Bacteroidota bacterium]